MDDRTHSHISHHKRDDSIGFIRMIRSNQNDETLQRVCQHLSVLIAIENNLPRPKSRNEQDYSKNILFPPNNTPAETTAPYALKNKMNRGKENWKRISTIVVKQLRVVNALKQYKRNNVNVSKEPLEQTTSSEYLTRETSSVITIDHLLTNALSFSDISKLVNSKNRDKDDQLPKLYNKMSGGKQNTTLGKSVWGHFKKSDPGSQEGPSGAQNGRPNTKQAKTRWHILSKTILTLVRVANKLNWVKTASPPEYTPPTSLASVIFIKRPGNYIDSVSTGSLSTVSENAFSLYIDSESENNSATSISK